MRPEPRALGNLFGREDAITANRCLDCGADCRDEYRHDWPMETIREYAVTGLCRRCQASAFGEDTTQCTCATPCCRVDIGVGVQTCGSQHCWIHGE